MKNVARETYYTITNSNGRQHGRWNDEFATQQEALAALQAEMGWDEIVESESYTIDNGSAVSCYATQEECDADQTGAYAPRVNEYERDVEVASCRRSTLLAEVVALVGDDGTGDLGVIIDHAEPGATAEDIADIVREARADAAAEVAS